MAVVVVVGTWVLKPRARCGGALAGGGERRRDIRPHHTRIASLSLAVLLQSRPLTAAMALSCTALTLHHSAAVFQRRAGAQQQPRVALQRTPLRAERTAVRTQAAQQQSGGEAAAALTSADSDDESRVPPGCRWVGVYGWCLWELRVIRRPYAAWHAPYTPAARLCRLCRLCPPAAATRCRCPSRWGWCWRRVPAAAASLW